MSWFSDFIVADVEEAEVIAMVDNPSEAWPTYSVKGLSELDLANLYSILAGGGDPVKLTDRFEVIFADEEGEGPMVSQIPDEFLELVADLDDDMLQFAGKQWCECEEFQGLADVEALRGVVVEIRRLAQTARENGKTMLFCTSGV